MPRGEESGKPARARRFSVLALCAIAFCGACEPPRSARASNGEATDVSSPIDSVLPIDVALRRFRQGLPVVRRLSGGAASRDGLVAAFVRALETGDSAALRRLHVSRAEFAYLYFPSSVYMREPYQQPPAIAWFLSSQNSAKGISRATKRLGGHTLAYRGYTCGSTRREGENTFALSCTVEYFDPVDSARVRKRLFGTILGRDSQFKFLTYANDF